MIYALAIIPSVILLIYIYAKDKKDKEPLRFLLKCFLWGIITIIPSFFIETVLDIVLEEFYSPGTLPYAVFDGFVVAAMTEEVCKYVALKKKTWKSGEFNCSFDGIVYAVFVSMGFATFENLMYVIEGDLATAIMRMFTAVPGHAYFAVMMGYFYSKAKGASITGDKKLVRKYKRKALVWPIILHGAYDCILFLDSDVVGEDFFLTAMLVWLVIVITEFVISLRLVHKSSKKDEYFELPEDQEIFSKSE